MKLGMVVCAIAIFFVAAFIYCAEALFIRQLSKCVPVSNAVARMLRRVAISHSFRLINKSRRMNRSLFSEFPKLQDKVQYCLLANLPTPINRLQLLEQALDVNCRLYLKDDGQTGMKQDGVRDFGGNKMRKLEFLLGDAIFHGAQSVMTFGCTGSNHVVATGAACKKMGLECYGMLKPQPITDIALRNRKLMDVYGIQTFESATHQEREKKAIGVFIQKKQETGHMPYVIPTGGSCPIGAIGFVNAAFELKEQIENGIIPKPDHIYLAVNSCGTIAGLLLGLKAAGLEIKVHGIVVEPDNAENPFVRKIVALAKETNELLHLYDNQFPLFSWRDEEIDLAYEFTGPEYGVEIPAACRAKQLLFSTEKIELDPTYTAKAFAGLLKDVQESIQDDAVVLFWNTFCSIL